MIKEEEFQNVEYDDEPIYDEEVDDEDWRWILYGDSGESLITCKSLLLPKQEIGRDRLRNIFHTICTIDGKVCKVIFDSGSFENVVSK